MELKFFEWQDFKGVGVPERRREKLNMGREEREKRENGGEERERRV